MPEPQPVLKPSDIAASRALIEALGCDYSIERLQHLHGLVGSGACVLARVMGIHVATAMRKLAELEGLGLLEKRPRTGGDVIEYRLSAPRVEILLDFDADAKTASRDAWRQAERILVKERPNRKVLLESEDQARRVRRILFLKVLRRRTEARTMELSEPEGRFLWQIPYASETGRSVAEIARRAGIGQALQLARILDFVRELERLGILEVVR